MGWTEVSTINPINIPDFPYQSISFVNDQVGWIAGGDYQSPSIIKTEDGGDTWTLQPAGLAERLNSIFFIDENTGWAAGDDSAILHTNNGGDTWITQSHGPTSSPNLTEIFFVDAQNGWAVGDTDAILYTNDGGNTWNEKLITPGSGYRSLFFSNAQVGYVGGYDAGFVADVSKTTDGGQTWQRLSIELGSQPRGIYFLNENEGWILGAQEEVFYTSDGGLTFEQLNEVNFIGVSRDFFFLNDQRGWMTTTSSFGNLLHTFDGGKSWLRQQLPINGFLSGADIYFSNNGKGWLATGRKLFKWDSVDPDFSGFTSIGEFEGHEYYISNEDDEWDYAQMAAFELGGYLAVINSQAENDFIQQNISEMAHIGMNDLAEESSPIWINDESIDYTNFDDCSFCDENVEVRDVTFIQNWNGKWSWGQLGNPRKYIVEVPCVSSGNNNFNNIENSLITIPILDRDNLTLDKLMPNPAIATIFASIFSSMENEVEIQIMDARGVLVKSERVGVHKGNNTIELNINDLPSGFYMMYIPDAQQKQGMKRFIKSRD